MGCSGFSLSLGAIVLLQVTHARFHLGAVRDGIRLTGSGSRFPIRGRRLCALVARRLAIELASEGPGIADGELADEAFAQIGERGPAMRSTSAQQGDRGRH